MDIAYALQYRTLHDRHWWFRARHRLVERHLVRYLGPRDVGPILDIGAGDGLFLPTLEVFGRPEGLEPEKQIVSVVTRERWPMHLCAFDSDFNPHKQYGLITMLDVLEHLDDDIASLSQVRELLATSGVVMLTVPALPLLWTRHDHLNHHRTRYTRATLKRAIQQADLHLLSMRYFFHWLVPVKLLIRVAELVTRGESRLPQVPKEPWNQLLHAFCRLEQETWGRLRLPFGTSILAVAARSAGCRP